MHTFCVTSISCTMRNGFVKLHGYKMDYYLTLHCKEMDERQKKAISNNLPTDIELLFVIIHSKQSPYGKQSFVLSTDWPCLSHTHTCCNRLFSSALLWDIFGVFCFGMSMLCMQNQKQNQSLRCMDYDLKKRIYTYRQSTVAWFQLIKFHQKCNFMYSIVHFVVFTTVPLANVENTVSNRQRLCFNTIVSFCC